MMFFKHGKDEIKELPVLPLREIVVFPYMVVPLFVGRQKSILALETARKNEDLILLLAQKNGKIVDPTYEDLYSIGTIGKIIQMLRWQDGTATVLIEGKRRARVRRFIENKLFFLAEVELIPESYEKTQEVEGILRSVKSIFEVYMKLDKKVTPETLLTIQTIEEPGKLADSISVHLSSLKVGDKQAILEEFDPIRRLELVYKLIQREIEILQTERKLKSKLKVRPTPKEPPPISGMEVEEGEFSKESEKDEFKQEIADFEQKMKEKKLSQEAREKLEREIKKLKMMSPMSAEATVVRNYIEWVLSLPWGEKTEENFDIEKAEQILEEDHYGLKKIKERILEYLAVQALVKKLKGPILCFVGPPGTGKTSLSKSIARATGRKFIRLSLGGVRDEAEIRGHRRTYIGALPGKIIQSLRKVGTDNPVFLLDEVDKMTSDYRGDPASALLEVLDPEQNYMFNDHYIDLDYDLSDVMFITTANTLEGIPIPLRDRLEIIELSSYTEFEKLNIALRYLIPKQKKECGLEDVDFTITESAVRVIINYYTREAGVRNLEREIASICRKVAREVLKKGKNEKIVITAQDVPKYLGIPKYDYAKSEATDLIGVTNGLSVTMYGGELLQVEVSIVKGKGELILTGKLGDVMQESAKAALTYVRSRSEKLGVDPEFYKTRDIHIHFPEGAVPKDGPSAGVTIATALVSALLEIPVKHDVAMTGEITLRGRVLQVGGIKEKLLAAHRSNIKTVIIPKENRRHLKEIPRKILQALRIVLVDEVDEILPIALKDESIALKLNLLDRERWEYIDAKLVKVKPNELKGEKEYLESEEIDSQSSEIEPSSPLVDIT